jgi:hypothetical protein
MRNAASVILVVSVGLGAVTHGHAEETITCPKRAQVGAGAIVSENSPDGFEAFVPSTSLLLTGVTVFDGPPKEGASLKPTKISANGASIQWVLEGATEYGTWVSCDYANGLVRLVKKLVQPIAVCSATLTKSGSPRTLEAGFRCK